MSNRDDPDDGEGKKNRRPEVENAGEIFPESHGGERDGRSEPDGRGNNASHEPKRGMINGRKKMILATGAGERRGQFSVTERTAKRSDAANDPEHDQSEPGMYLRKLKAEAGENTGADNVRDDNSAGGVESDGARGHFVWHREDRQCQFAANDTTSARSRVNFVRLSEL